jgi:hypothetical protein
MERTLKLHTALLSSSKVDSASNKLNGDALIRTERIILWYDSRFTSHKNNFLAALRYTAEWAQAKKYEYHMSCSPEQPICNKRRPNFLEYARGIDKQ